MAYILDPLEGFLKEFDKLNKQDPQLSKRVSKTLDLLRKDPEYPGLRTHKIYDHSVFGAVKSSRVTGDIRILWAFDKNRKLVIILIQVGDHDYVY